MLAIHALENQTLTVRETIGKQLREIPVEHADVIPATWNNNARWHAGHLVLTPQLLTLNVRKQPLISPDEFRGWFAKGTAPAAWGDAKLPAYLDLIDDIVPSAGRVFEQVRETATEPYAEAYMTSMGVALHTPMESLAYSLFHDGIHLGFILALKRALQAQRPAAVGVAG